MALRAPYPANATQIDADAVDKKSDKRVRCTPIGDRKELEQ